MMRSSRIGTSSSFARSCRATELRVDRSEEHTSELQSQSNLVCRLLLEKKKRSRERQPVLCFAALCAKAEGVAPETSARCACRPGYRPLPHSVLQGLPRCATRLSRHNPKGPSAPSCSPARRQARSRGSPARVCRRHRRKSSPRCGLQTGLLRFFFKYPATTEINTLSLHDALPI